MDLRFSCHQHKTKSELFGSPPESVQVCSPKHVRLILTGSLFHQQCGLQCHSRDSRAPNHSNYILFYLQWQSRVQITIVMEIQCTQLSNLVTLIGQ